MAGAQTEKVSESPSPQSTFSLQPPVFKAALDLKEEGQGQKPDISYPGKALDRVPSLGQSV